MDNYILKESYTLSRPKSDLSLWVHKTGARVVFIKNDDKHRAFTAAFCTPPENSRGIPHIVEHSVFCGSKKYPLKDPFVQLMKGSLNTFLNAITYSDMTLFPVASTNKKDFDNLTDVYLDAIFNPAILNEPAIFGQEGWHYEYDSDNNLQYNGVVFNEMRGLSNDCDFLHNNAILQSLFEDTCYNYVSGGLPCDIINASYKEMKDFYCSHYHPANCILIMYGDNDIEEKLEYFDKNYLSKYSYIANDIKKTYHIDMQKPHKNTVRLEKVYPIDDESYLDNGYCFSYNIVYSDNHNLLDFITMIVINHCLCSAQGSYIKEALIKEGIGELTDGIINTKLRQPIFSIMCYNCHEDDEKMFFKTIEDTLENVVKKGIDKDRLHSVIKSYDFHSREDSSDYTSKGIYMAEQLLDTLLYYEDNPLEILDVTKAIDFLKEMADTDYFERFIEDRLINNTFKSNVVMKPVADAIDAENDYITDKALAYYNSCNKDELDLAIKKQLEFQKTPDSEEALSLIKTLTKDDLDPEFGYTKPKITDINGTTVYLLDNVTTNGIGYLSLMFDLSGVSKEHLIYARFLGELIGALNTINYSYDELNSLVNYHTGGIYHKLSCTPDFDNENFPFYLIQKSSFLYESCEKNMELNLEFINGRLFNDKEHIYDLLLSSLNSMREYYQSSPYMACTEFGENQYSKYGILNDQFTGYSYYQFLNSLIADFDARYDEFINMLSETADELFTRQNCILTYIGEKGSYEQCLIYFKKFLDELPSGDNNEPYPIAGYYELSPKKNLAYCLNSTVCNVTLAGRIAPDIMQQYRGHFIVLEQILNYEYLWQNVRVMGGAYDCAANLRYDGFITIASVRDPHIKETLDVFHNISTFIRNLSLTERELTQYIIGAYNNMTLVFNPVESAAIDISKTLCNITYESVVNIRKQLINTTLSDIRNLADIFEDYINNASVIVSGNSDIIDKNNSIFDEISELL